MTLGGGRRWAAAFVLCGIGCCTFAADRPNLLIIMTDNQSPSLLGAYGNSEIRTPNIDRLADFFKRYVDPRYDLWQGGTAKLRLFGAADQELFGEEFAEWKQPGLGFDQTIFRDE